MLLYIYYNLDWRMLFRTSVSYSISGLCQSQTVSKRWNSSACSWRLYATFTVIFSWKHSFFLTHSLYFLVMSTLINTFFIMIMSVIYKMVVVKLTKWENYRTKTEYHDNLILKLFTFEFVNNYGPLVYLAYFRNASLFIL